MQVHLVSGFLGSGKTTAIGTACKALLDKGYKAGVIVNDQGICLVDSGYFKKLSIPNKGVTGGCFCCNYNALDTHLQSLLSNDKLDIIFAESVGSCTDIVATVMKPLQRFRDDIEVTVSTFADVRLLYLLYIEKKPLFANEVAYIFQKQLEEASVIIITKTDLTSEGEIKAVQDYLYGEYPGKKVVCINGTSQESVGEWLNVISGASGVVSLPSLQINYATYGAGEAALAWLDEEIKMVSHNNDAIREAIKLAGRIYQTISNANLSIGHLKFLIDDAIKLSYTATTQPDIVIHHRNVPKVTMLINARVQTTPDVLQAMVKDCMKQTQQESKCNIRVSSLASFQPGYPTPTYRMTD